MGWKALAFIFEPENFLVFVFAVAGLTGLFIMGPPDEASTPEPPTCYVPTRGGISGGFTEETG